MIGGAPRPGRAGAPGFTLVEVMVAGVLLSVIAGGLFASITIVGRAQATSAGVDVAQAGVRASFELLSRDVRMACAGTTSCVLAAPGQDPSTTAGIAVTNASLAPDRLDLLLLDARTRATVVAPANAGAGMITVDDASALAAGDTIEITDFSAGALLTVSAVISGVGTSTVFLAGSTPCPRGFGAGSLVFRTRRVAYFVDSVTFGATNPLLVVDGDGPGPLAPQPIAEGIEDLQIALGIDLDGDGSMRQVGVVAGDDEWIGNVAGEVAPADLAMLRAVRITVVARTPSASLGGLRGQRPGAEDHAGAPLADAFPRRVLRTVVTIRNLSL